MPQPDARPHPHALEPPQFKRLLRRALLPPLVLLCVLVAVLLWQVGTLLVAQRRVQRSDQIITHVGRLQHEILVPSADRPLKVTDLLYEEIRELTATSPEQAARVEQALPLLARWHALRTSSDATPGQRMQIADQLQALLATVLAEETALRDERSARVWRSALITVIGGVSLAAVLGLIMTRLARRQMMAIATHYADALETARNRTNQVQQSEALLRLITDTLPSVVAYVDAEQRYRFTNRAHETYRGLTNEQVHGKHVREVLGDDAYARVRHHVESALRGNRVAFDGVTEFERAGAREVHVEYLPHVDARGRVAGFVTLIVDTTARNQAQREMARSEERYRTFVRQSSEGIWRFELDDPIPISASVEQQIELLYKRGYLAECNDAMAQMYGLDRAEQIIGARLGDLLVRDDPTNVAYLKAFVHAGYRLAEGESVERDAHGNARHFVNNLVGFVEDGKLIRAWGTQRDITDRKRAEDERDALLERERAARAEAERAGRVKDEFLSTLSHELRTPLNAILGWAQLLRRSGDIDADDLRQGLETIERNSRTQAQLIDDLLDMSRIIAGKIRLEIARVEVLGVIDAAIDTVRQSADAKGVALYKHANALAEVSVMGDPRRLQQIVWNLLSNAIKFTPPGGRVDLTLGRFGEQVEITVADTGAGIHLDFLPHVFERFRQADSSSTRQHGGLGLGLSIVRQMTEMHGGTAHAHSDGPGHGATFRILLPVAAVRAATPASNGYGNASGNPAVHDNPLGSSNAIAHANSNGNSDGSANANGSESATGDGNGNGNGNTTPGTPGRTDAPAPAHGNPRVPLEEPRPGPLMGLKVLVVDDEPDALELIRRQLIDAEAEVFTAATAAEALHILAAEHPHALVSDIGMPHQDGLWLVEQLRAAELHTIGSADARPRTPAIALSAFARPEDRARAVEAGYDLHLSKPAEAAELIAIIANLCRAHVPGSR